MNITPMTYMDGIQAEEEKGRGLTRNDCQTIPRLINLIVFLGESKYETIFDCIVPLIMIHRVKSGARPRPK